jgi:NAD(P)-dependent dehydrogenase (short-subunit alcohol dehydrogenase family)
MKRLSGKTALITGGTGGLGRATAERLAAEGARVFVADINQEAAQAVASSVGGVGLEIDVMSDSSVKRAFAETAEQAGGLDILVNCAGIVDARPLDELDLESWSRVFDINLRGTWLTSKTALEYMTEGGSIINIGSRAGLVGGTTSGASYAASKAGVICFTKSLAKFAAPRGIRANVVTPGVIDTPMLENFTAEVQAEMPRQAAMKRLGRPEEVAATIAFLASEDSSFMTGAQLNVNGGSHM